MIIIGYTLALVMGITLGLLGGGGSILTVPILTYIMGISAVKATAYSLFIVGVGALFGSYKHFKNNNINIKIGLVFAVPAFISVYLTRKVLVPWVPQEVLTLGSFILTKDALILIVFAIVMILASFSMIKGRKETAATKDKKFNYPLIILEGLIVGGITGFVGAGGGFVIVPALVILDGLEMKVAVGTSLFIICIKSLIGFLGDVQNNANLDWQLLGIFTSISIVGILIGAKLTDTIPSSKLKPFFGWFVLVMGVAMLLKELL